MQHRILTLVVVSSFILCLYIPIAHTQSIPNPNEMTVATLATGQIATGQIATVDPAVCYDTASGELIQNVYETLVFFDREKIDQFVPMLATSWTISPDGLTYTFKIRGTDGGEPPVKFHNGHTLTTEDVEYSFERAMVYDAAPYWMFYEPLLNRLGSCDEAGNIVVTADQINSAITRTATTVTFHLSIPYPPFLQILSQPWSSILSKEWCVALGDWPGTWDNWQDYNWQPSPIDLQGTAAPGPHLNAMCGTGPYYLEYVDNDLEEWSIRKFEDYWHGWPAPGANSFLERVRVTWHYAWPDRKTMFLNGQADMVAVPRTNVNEILGQPGVRCVYPLPTLVCDAMFYSFDIRTSSPYMGVPGGLPRGTLDESGIPPDFFTDIDVRKGFAYSVNYTELISEVYLGEAYQPATPIVWGLPFYNPAQEKYTINLTMAEEHLRAAWGGQLWTEGFSMTVCYNIGNLMRQRLCEIIKESVESLNPRFHIYITELPWNEYLPQRDNHELVIFSIGWLADFSDPHNFAFPFMHSQGPFASRQDYRNATIDTLVEQGIRQTDVEQRRQIYYELQSLYHEDCPSVPLDQARGRHFERDWVQGWYYNPLLCGNYYYGLWKEEIPPAQVNPGNNVIDALTSSDTKVFINTKDAGYGSVSIAKYDINIEGTIPGNIVSINCVIVDTTVPSSEIVFPIEIRVYYTNEQIISAYVDQSTLRMYYWNETSQEWMLEPNSGWVTPSDVPGYSGYVWARVYHLSVFAAMGKLKSQPSQLPVGGEWAPIETAQAVAPYMLLALVTLAALATGSLRRLKKR